MDRYTATTLVMAGSAKPCPPKKDRHFFKSLKCPDKLHKRTGIYLFLYKL